MAEGNVRDWLDHPFIFLIVMSMGTAAVLSLFAWFFVTMGWTGPLSLVKGGVK